MREKLNSNPLLQLAVVGVLLVGTGFFVLSTTGGKEEEEATGPAEATVSVAGTGASGTATGATPGEAVEGAVDAAIAEAAAPAIASALSLVQGAASAAPPPPRPVIAAWEANKTLVLLFVRDGGIDDRLVRSATAPLSSLPGVATFVVPARRIARYAAIAEGVGVERTPALVVVSPKHVDHVVPTASVHYGFQHPESVLQAVVDAGYEGRTVDYHP